MEERKISEERQKIFDKIAKCENEGFFDSDLEDDPQTKMLYPDQVDYLHKKLKTKIMSFIVNKKANKIIDNLIKNNQIIIKEIKGIENLKDIKGSAFITSNHFHPYDNIAILKAITQNMPNKHKFYRIIREGNYTASPMGLDLFFKYANTLPLSSNIHTMEKFMKALETLTKKNTYILIYPEQYLWYNYKKPRPLKDGTFKFSYKYNTPIIPCFITMQDSKYFDADNLPIQEYTVHIMPAIYPNKKNNIKDETKRMKELNYQYWKDTYEKEYKIPLTFDIKN